MSWLFSLEVNDTIFPLFVHHFCLFSFQLGYCNRGRKSLHMASIVGLFFSIVCFCTWEYRSIFFFCQDVFSWAFVQCFFLCLHPFYLIFKGHRSRFNSLKFLFHFFQLYLEALFLRLSCLLLCLLYKLQLMRKFLYDNLFLLLHLFFFSLNILRCY